jgi:hypothetical protein
LVREDSWKQGQVARAVMPRAETAMYSPPTERPANHGRSRAFGESNNIPLLRGQGFPELG